MEREARSVSVAFVSLVALDLAPDLRGEGEVLVPEPCVDRWRSPSRNLTLELSG